jgi:hypothetical protein
MISKEEIGAALERMEEAEPALLAYPWRPKSQPQNIKLHAQLTLEFENSKTAFQDLMVKLAKEQAG